MRYILKYKIRSKYLHFSKEAIKEFEEINDVIDFIKKNKLYSWTLYEKYLFAEGEENE